VIVFFNTVRRKRPVRKAGELIKLDWNSKKILSRCVIYPTDPDILDDPNPRGNTRGGKGILVTEEEVFVGTYHTILVFDHDLNLKRRITHRLFVNLHEMSFDGKNILVSSTAIDAALLVSRRGRLLRSWWPREEESLREALGLIPQKINKRVDNRLRHYNIEPSGKPGHTHLNSVFTYKKSTFALLKRYGVIVRLCSPAEVFLAEPSLRGSHSPAITPSGDLLVVCGSMSRELLIFDTSEKSLKRRLKLLDIPEIAAMYSDHPDEPYNQSIFVRGLEVLDEKRALVGISPAAILEVDIETGKLLDMYRHSREVGDAVHGLACITRPSPPKMSKQRGGR
jgi:hypothetical protein